MGMHRLAAVLFFFSSYPAVEKLHPLQGGIFRSEVPPRPASDLSNGTGLGVLSEILVGNREQACTHGAALVRHRLHAPPHPARSAHRAYTDQALTAVADDDAETLDLLTQNDAARREVERSRRIGRPKVAATA